MLEKLEYGLAGAILMAAMSLGLIGLTTDYEPDYNVMREQTVRVVACPAGVDPREEQFDKCSGRGSGVILDGETILTAGHVATMANPVNGNRLWIEYFDGEVRAAETIWTKYLEEDRGNDLAALRTPVPVKYDTFPNVNCSALAVGDEVYLSGSPAVLEWTITEGTVATDRSRTLGHDTPRAVLDITVWNGNSGGPVYNEHGEVVGIAVEQMLDSVGYGLQKIDYAFAIPGAEICTALSE